MFRTVWFSYIRLQRLDTNAQCPLCGPMPQDTIWDGITLAFNRKHLLPSLRPPTTLHADSLCRNTARYLAGQQLITDAQLRKLVRKVIAGRSVLLPGDSDDNSNDDDANSDAPNLASSHAIERAAKDMISRIESIPDICTRLTAIHPALGQVFTEHFGISALAAKRKPPIVYRRLLHQLTAEESVLQMANRPALAALHDFLEEPSDLNASRLVGIPVIYNTLQYHQSNRQVYPPEFMSLCQWIYDRGQGVLNSLICYSSPPILSEESVSTVSEDWRKTGSHYGIPHVRHRPQYPNLKHDMQNEPGGRRGAKCSKFYSEYGEQRLTGGIMCAWCTHSICYGFHCIPRGEGRNDVFSAMLTRWPTAPKVVVYDFACALGPYCMTREPDFFADTLFVIDNFHAKGHTKCSPSAFLSTYSGIDPRLAHINSSAAECGNGVLNRIRKSVSYMSQDRSIMYTMVFLAVWNRLKIRKLRKEMHRLQTR
ncbi:hypothetical protein PLICRDRAFT_87458 [Plicaturopsis crispa FD-325 SS-3]|nr:hypothetical protein PLICRDRAFT_87458 [Plicaturopsis crispa FD-325 SS-3]